jgi:hypothetical protein
MNSGCRTLGSSAKILCITNDSLIAGIQAYHIPMEHKEFYLEKAHQFRDIAQGISATRPVIARELFALAASLEAAVRKDEKVEAFAQVPSERLC